MVRYPSRRTFLELLSHPSYAPLEPYKFMALEIDLVPVSGDKVIPDMRWLVGGGSAQTLAFAFIAALYPVGLLAITFLLASDRPMTLGLSFFAGAATTLFVVGVLMLTVLESAGLGDSDSGTTRGGFQIGFGTAMLVAAWLIWRRPAPTGPKKEPSWKARSAWSAAPCGVLHWGHSLRALGELSRVGARHRHLGLGPRVLGSSCSS